MDYIWSPKIDKELIAGPFRKLLDNFRGNTGLRGPILKLLSGSGYASLAGYVGMLVLVRLYPKEAWAINDYVISLVGVLAPVVTLRYEDALMLAEDKRDAAHAFLLACLSTLVFSIILFFLLPLSFELGFMSRAPEAVRSWIWIVPVVLIIHRVSKISELWLIRLEEFDRVPIGQVAQVSTMVVTRIGIGFFSSGPAGLIIGYTIGWVANLFAFGSRVVNSISDALGEGFSFDRIKYIAVRYRRFPAYTMPAAMISALGTRLPVLVLAAYFTLETVGEYGMAIKLLFIPLSFIGVAVGQVFFVRATAAFRIGKLSDISATIHNRMVMMVIMPTLLVIAAGPNLFEFLLGQQWRASGEMIQYLAPWIFFTSVASPLTRLFDVMERQRLELITNIAIIAVIATALGVGIYLDDVTSTLILVGVSGALIRIVQMVTVLVMAGVDMLSILYPYTRYGLYASPLALLVWGISQYYSPFLSTVTAVLAAFCYVALVVVRDGYLKDQ